MTAFLLDEINGQMQVTATAPTGPSPGYPAVTPDRRFLFVGNTDGNTITRLALDGNGGMKSAGPDIKLVDPSARPVGTMVSPSGRFLFVATVPNAVEAFSIGSQNGELTPVPGSPFAVDADANTLAITHSGKFLFVTGTLYSDAIYVFAIDQGNGTLARIATFHTGFLNCAMAVDPTDTYLVVNAYIESKLLLFKIDPTGQLQEAPGSRVPSSYLSTSIAISPDGRYLYMDDALGRGINSHFDNGILGWKFDALSGSILPMPDSPFLDNQVPSSVAVSPKGTILVVSRVNDLDVGHVASYRIDSTSGALRPLSGTGFDSGILTGGGPNHVVLVPRS